MRILWIILLEQSKSCTYLQLPRQKEEDEAIGHAQEGELKRILDIPRGVNAFPVDLQRIEIHERLHNKNGIKKLL